MRGCITHRDDNGTWSAVVELSRAPTNGAGTAGSAASAPARRPKPS